MTTVSDVTGGTGMMSSVFNTSVSHSPDNSIAGYNLPSPDINTLRGENRVLKARLKEVQTELQNEQDNVSSVRRRLNNMDRERLEAVTKANQQVSHLDGEVARLRALCERGEATRQSLEYELARARKDTTAEKRSATERESLMSEVNDSMKQKISELSQQMESLCGELERTKAHGRSETDRLRNVTEDKEKLLCELRGELDGFDVERERYLAAVQMKDETIRTLEEKLTDLENETRKQGDALHTHMVEAQVWKEKEQSLRKEFEHAQTRIQTLEENIEAERASHLESKFNSEIVQLRIKDLDNALELERSSKVEALSNIDKLNQQMRELQHICDDERRSGQQNIDKLEHTEKDYSLLNKQLRLELEEKRSVIKKLSEQLESHQHNFNELKQELTKTKKRQMYLEETYSGNMRELELLLDTYTISESVGDKDGKKKTGRTAPPGGRKKEPSKKPAPGIILQGIRYTLSDYKHKLDEATANLMQIKAKNEHLTKECQQYKDRMWAKDKTLENLQQGVSKSSKELSKVQHDTKDLSTLMTQLREELDSTKHSLDKEKTLSHSLSTQVYQLEASLSQKDALIASMQKSHDDQLDKMAAIAEGRTQHWQQQKAELEKHYTTLLAEIHTRQKKTQALADQAWEKVRATGSVQHGLEAECNQVRQQLLDSQREHDTLLLTCALLCGAFYPMYCSVTALSVQRHLLAEQANRFDTFKQEMTVLTDALALGSEDCKQTAQERIDLIQAPVKRSVRLRFRSAVIAVIATNRLANLVQGNCSMFTSHDVLPLIHSTRVCSGFVDPVTKKYTGVSNPWILENDKVIRAGQEAALGWLASHDLLSTVMATMGDLNTAVQKAKQGDQATDTHKLVSVSQKCFHKFVCHLPSMFPSIVPTDPSLGVFDTTSLMRRLAGGLHKALVEAPLDGTNHVYTASQGILGNLQKHVLELTQRLHEAEVERRDLRIELSSLRQQQQDWVTHELGSLEDEVKVLRVQVTNSVNRDHFESICDELNSALKREEKITQLMNDQARQIEQLTEQLDSQDTEGSQKEHTLEEAYKGLNDAKMELKRQGQHQKQVSRKVAQLEAEKKTLMENVSDAENALRTAAKDRESVLAYIRQLEKALETGRVRKFLATTDDDTTDLGSTLFCDIGSTNVGKLGPELAACQGLVATFSDAVKQLSTKITTQQQDIASQKDHINSLKKELSDACKREFDEEMHVIGHPSQHDNSFRVVYVSDQQKNHSHDHELPSRDLPVSSGFVPQEGCTFRPLQPQESPGESPPQYVTPQVSRRSSSSRRKRPDEKT